MSMDISKVPELVDHSGYPLMIESYRDQPLVYPIIADVRDISDDMMYGVKGSVITGMGDFEDREDGEEFEADEFVSGPTWYCKIHQWGRSLIIPDRMARTSDAVGRISNLVGEMSRTWGRSAALKKDKWVADVLQQGTLTAGSLTYFDGSFPNNADPNPKVIYDGLPFFDTAHTISVGSSTYANHTASGSALTKSNLETHMRTMRVTNAVDERGREILVAPDTLIVPFDIRETALAITESELLPGTAQNDINTARGVVSVVPWRFLDDAASSAAYWICERGQGLRVYDSGEPVIEISYDAKRKCHVVTAETHFGVVVTGWQYWYCANKAAS